MKVLKCGLTFLLSTRPCFRIRFPSTRLCHLLPSFCFSSCCCTSSGLRSVSPARLRGRSGGSGVRSAPCKSRPRSRVNCLSSSPGSKWSGTQINIKKQNLNCSFIKLANKSLNITTTIVRIKNYIDKDAKDRFNLAIIILKQKTLLKYKYK